MTGIGEAPPTRCATWAMVVVTMLGLHWRRLRRDPVALAFALVLPVALAAMLGSIYAAEGTGRPDVGLVSGESAVQADLVGRLDADPALDLQSYADRDALDRALRRREVDAGVVIPDGAGFGSSSVELVGAPGIETPGGARAAVEAAVAETGAAVQLGHALAPDDPLGSGLATARQRLSGEDDPARVPTDHDGTSSERDETTAAILAVLVLFVFMNTMGGSASWAETRELGVVARLRSTSATPSGVAAGYGLGLATFAAVQALIILAVGAVLFDVTVRAPGALAVSVGATAVAAGGLAVLVATLLPSSSSGNTIAGPLAFVLAMLGGCLWPLNIVPSALAAVGRATPHLWAVDGLRAAAIDGSGLVAVAGNLAVLVIIAVLAGSVGAWRMERQVASA